MSQIHPIPIIIKKWRWDDNEGFNLDSIFVFIGHDIPGNITKALADFEKKINEKYTNKVLDSYFGGGFVKKITGIFGANGRGGNQVGGDATDDTLDIPTSVDMSLFETNEESEENMPEIPEDEPEPLPGLTDSTISIHEILKKQDDEHKTLKVPKPAQEATRNVNGKSTLSFIYENIWSVETPMDLKNKIWVYLNVPSICQHLTYYNGIDNIPVQYNIYNNNKLIKINLLATLHSADKYNGIPILNHYYAFRDFFKIKSMENFTLIEKFSEGIFDLYDSRDFLKKVELKSQRDQNTQSLLYYGFFILFWPIFTFEMFQEYVHTLIANLPKIYPELFPNKTDLKESYKKENELFGSFHSLYDSPKSKSIVKEIEKHLFVQITNNNVLNFAFGTSAMVILSLRNIFDKLPMSDTFVAIKFITLHNNTKITLNKTFKNEKEIDMAITLNSLMLRCNVYDKAISGSHTFDITLYDNGNYFVKCLWNEQSTYTFHDGTKFAASFINEKLIKVINGWKGIMINESYKLPCITENNVQYSHIGANIFYRKNLSSAEVRILHHILAEFNEARIFESGSSDNIADNYNLTYYMLKGNHQQDTDLIIKKNPTITNTYEYLSKEVIGTKWSQLYVHNKLINIYLRQTDVRFILNGMWDIEFNILYSYIILAIYLTNLNSTLKNSKYADIAKKSSNVSISAARNSKQLKQLDPVLYDFRRYSSKLTHSRICQKPNQPHLLTQEELESLSAKEKNKVVKYWNFTTQTDAYYYAPNPKYPYINFIVGKHPAGFCIPCAKKSPVTNKNKTKKMIYDICMKEHKYEKERKNLIQETRYIMNYGKPIDVGRLCKLPENTMEPLFYESFSEYNGIDEECFKDDRYLLFGVEQKFGDVLFVGFLNILLMALETNITDLIATLTKSIKAKPNMFNTILDGAITKHFNTHKDFTDAMHQVFLSDSLVSTSMISVPWNDIFIDIAFSYLSIVTVEFVDYVGKRSNFDQSEFIKHESDPLQAGDMIELVMNNKIDVILSNPDSYRYVLVLRKLKYVTPVFFLNPFVYYKTKLINKMLFDNKDNITRIISNLLTHNDDAGVDNPTRFNNHYLYLNTIKNFVSATKFNITEFYINKHNQCYYIGIKYGDKSTFYIPVVTTEWTPVANVTAKYEICSYKSDFSQINEFLLQYNKWIGSTAIHIEKWIGNGKAKTCCGFMFSGVNFYFTPIPLAAALKIKDVPVWNIPYNIVDINSAIYNNKPIKSDKLVSQISDHFYEHHIYQLLIIEFTSLLCKEKNIKLRTEIKKAISLNKKLLDIFEDIFVLLTSYYSGNPGDMVDVEKIEDYNSVIMAINEVVSKQQNKSFIYAAIDSTVYNFDKLSVNRLRTMPRDKIYKELYDLSKKIVQIGTVPKPTEIPNILSSCSLHPAYYCKGTKLIMSEQKLKRLLDILAADIQNPIKEKWLFSPIFSENVIDFLKFESHPNTNITIEV